jgi:hypothetical protein
LAFWIYFRGLVFCTNKNLAALNAGRLMKFSLKIAPEIVFSSSHLSDKEFYVNIDKLISLLLLK